LQNFIDRAVVMTEGRMLCPQLPELTHTATTTSNEPARTLVEVERIDII
jgi:hypothetical protein